MTTLSLAQAPNQTKTLPNELTSLIHHIELNKSGWWQKSIDRFIIAAIWLAKKPLNVKAISESITDFGFQIDSNGIRSSLERLSEKTDLVKFYDGTYKISEASLAQFENEIGEAEIIEEKAKKTFVDLLKSYDINLNSDETWLQFNELLLQPMIRDLGASTYRFLSGQTGNLIRGQSEVFLAKFSDPIRQLIAKLLNEFFDPKNSFVRSYILRHLNAHFCVQASHLDKQALDKIAGINRTDTILTLFVDTNFLFSILGLHENPADETALFLNELSQKMPPNIKLKFYALPATLEESRDVIRRNIVNLHMTPRLAEAALTSHVSGIIKKFAEATIRLNKRISAEDYFHDYLENTILVIRSKKIELFNVTTDEYNTRQYVIDDLLEQQEFERNHFGHTAKFYKALEHDVTLWHFVHEQRKKHIESPLDVRYWIVTLDYRFLGFDEHKRHKLGEKYPVCMHPTTLVQLLQFWLPRTQELEAALLGTIRLPFMLQEFDRDSERVTMRILSALSHYEDGSGLPKETIGQLLLDDVIRQKIKNEPDVQKQLEIVQNAIIADNAKVREQLELHKNEADRLLKEQLALKDLVIETLNSRVEEIKLESTIKEKELAADLRKSDEVIFNTQKNLADLRDTLAYEKQEKEDKEKKAQAEISLHADELKDIKKKFLALEAEQKAEQDKRLLQIQWRKDFFRVSIGVFIILSVVPFWILLVENRAVRGLPINAFAVSVAIIAGGLACIFIKRALVIGIIGIILTVVLEVPQIPVWEKSSKKDIGPDLRQPSKGETPDLRAPNK